MRATTFVSCTLLAGLAVCALQTYAMAGTPAPTKTIANLKAAYLGETTAHAKYAVYARAADKQGLRDIARLFRAASEAEKIHAQNHQHVLAILGVKKLNAGTYSLEPGTTRENLADALKGETYERDIMYPAMVEQARGEGQADAERSMLYALSAEKQHASLYKAAMGGGIQKQSVVRSFYVCPECGATFTVGNVPAECKVCGTPKSKFDVVK